MTVGLADFNDSGSPPTLAICRSSSALFRSEFGDQWNCDSLRQRFPHPLSFDFYPIDTTHFKVVETDNFGSSPLGGDVFTQTSPPSSGTVPFTMSGGASGTTESPTEAGGDVTTDGTGNFPAALRTTTTRLRTQFPVYCWNRPPLRRRPSQWTLTAFSFCTETNLTFAAYPSSGGCCCSNRIVWLPSVQAPPILKRRGDTSHTQGYGLNLTGFNATMGSRWNDGDMDEFATVQCHSASTGNMTGIVR